MVGASLDVLRNDPAPADHPFRSHPKITLTPYMPAMTLPELSIAQISQKFAAFQSGQSSQSIGVIVHRERVYYAEQVD